MWRGRGETRLEDDCWTGLFHHQSHGQACCQQTEHQKRKSDPPHDILKDDRNRVDTRRSSTYYVAELLNNHCYGEAIKRSDA